MADDPDDDVDGGFVVSLPIPKDHWVYEPNGEPPAPLEGMGAEERDRMERAVRAAGKYAIRGATISGRSPDFDPDALVQALVVGLLSYAKPEAQLLGTEEPAP